MKYSLRSLMIVVLVGPPLLAGAWYLRKSLLEKPSALLEEVRNTSILDQVESERGPTCDIFVRLPNSLAPAPNLPKN